MKPRTTSKLLPLAATMLAMGITSSTFAGSYAVSNARIYDGTIVVSDPTEMSFLIAGRTSAASASLNGVGVSTGGAGVINAPVANGIGSVPARLDEVVDGAGNYIVTGPLPTSYSHSDAKIVSEQTVDGAGNILTKVEVRNMAEGMVYTGQAEGRGINSSNSVLSVQIDVNAPGNFVTFDFWADAALSGFITADSKPGSFARAILNATVTMTDAVTGATVFEWKPQGTAANDVTGTVGGLEIVDGFDLNQDRSTFIAALPFSSSVLGAHFTAQTGLLPVGTYNMQLEGIEQQSVLHIPEPGTLALLGLGLAGMGIAGRRRKA